MKKLLLIFLIGIFLVSFSSAFNSTLNADLTDYWTFNEGAGTTVGNNLSSSRNGTVQNGATWNSSGVLGGAIYINGSNQQVNFTRIPSFEGIATSYTLNFWLRYIQDYSGTSGRIFAYNNETAMSGANEIYFQNPASFTYNIGSWSGTEQVDTGVSSTVPTDFVMLTLVKNATNITLYVNGSMEYAGLEQGGDFSEDYWFILNIKDGAHSFEALYDEMGIWNRALPPEQVDWLWNSGNGAQFEDILQTTLLTPIDGTNFVTKTINFSANVEGGGVAIKNVTINAYDSTGLVWSETNTSGISGIYNFTNIFSSYDDYKWNITSIDDSNTKYYSTTKSFNISSFILNSETYTSPTFEGLSHVISANFLTNGSDITSATLKYNSTSYAGTINNHGSNNFTITRTLTAPSVDSNTNVSFNWSIIQTSKTSNTTTKTQQINNLAIDNCTINTHLLYNFTMMDEELQTPISLTTARLNLQIYGLGGSTLIESYNKTYTNLNPFTVCLSTNLSTGGSFSSDLQVQYLATGYSSELYHIQKEIITIADFPTNINLRDLNSTDTQIFKIIFRDSSFLPVEDALIKIYRKYIDENEFKIVEIPMTDSRGEAVASLVVNDVIYKFEIVKNGVTLATFTDVVAVCQTPLVSSCEIDLNAFSDTIDLPDFETAEDFNFTLGYDTTTRLISSQFVIPSGTTKTISLNVTMEDALGTLVCSDILTSSSGTLSCTVPANFGNATAIAKLYKDGVLQAQGQIKLDNDPSDIYGVSLVLLSLFVMITLIGAGLSNNPIFTIIFFMVGVVLLFTLNLVSNNGFIGATATVLFLFIAIIIVIIKASGRN